MVNEKEKELKTDRLMASRGRFVCLFFFGRNDVDMRRKEIMVDEG